MTYREVTWSKSFFFFQAEDGIRDLTVTGVQTCALPIYGRLILGVRPVGIGVVAEHQPQVGLSATREADVGVADGGRAGVGRPRITQDPDTSRLRRAARGRGDNEMIGAPASERLRCRADGVGIPGAG